MRVVEVEDIGADGVEERGVQCIEAFHSANDGRVTCAREWRDDAEGMVDGDITTPTECGGEEIEQRALRFVLHCGRHVFRAGGGEEFREVARQSGRRS